MVNPSNYAVLFLVILCSSGSYQNPVRPSTQQLQDSYGDALEAILGIGVRLQALLDDPTQPSDSNFLVSPLSVALTVGQLMLGAEGKFRRELYHLLSLPESDDHKFNTIHYRGKNKNTTYHLPYAKLHLQMGNLVRALERKEIIKNFTLSSTNALFVNTQLDLKKDFVHNLQIYETQVTPVNFSTDPIGSQKIINDWAASETNGAIKNVLPSPLPITATAIFSNAIYFLADWETPFSYQANIKGPFHSTKDKEVEVEYMRGFFDDIPYAESATLGCKMVAFPYKNNEVAMYFMLPNENNGTEYDLRKFTDKLNAKHVLEMISQMKNHSVAMQVPKMKLSNSLSILEPLRKYYAFKQHQARTTNQTGDPLDILEGLKDEFVAFNATDETDIVLTGAAEKSRLKITNILQQMTLSVDEKGTEAAAVTLSVVDYIGGVQNFRLDRPFVFFIRHELTSATLFWGTIVNPAQSS